MTTAAVLVLVVLGVAYAVYAVPIVFQFRTYCEHVAKATGRTQENQSLRNTDDGGNNAFQREQWRKLLVGDFEGIHDPSLAARGRVLTRKTRMSYLLAIVLVVAVVITQQYTQ